MSYAPSQEQRWDHRRDLAKHDIRPSDQRYALAALVGYCEGLCASGALNDESEWTLRHLVADTLAAFQMPSKSERSKVSP